MQAPYRPWHCPAGTGAATQPGASTGLPEAPASANVYVDIGGREVQVTLRDTDEDRLMARMERMMVRYPLEEAPTEAAQTSQEKPEGYCDIHQVQMYWNEAQDGPGGWWSHKTAEGWCKGKPRLARR